MREKSQKLKTLAESTDTLVYNLSCSVHDSITGESSLQTVRFVLKLLRDDEGFFPAHPLDDGYNTLSDRGFRFSSVEEFFAMANYIKRNGLVKNVI